MVVPEGSDRAYSRTYPITLVKILGAVLILWLVSLVVLTVFYSRLSLTAAKAVMLENENHNLRGYLARVVDIEESLKKNRELTAQLASMAGVDLEDFDGPPQVDLQSFEDEESAFNYEQSSLSDDTLRIPLSPEELARERIPAGRPLYGWITRPYEKGEESKPDKHSGMDFAVKKGTAVKATASGVVIFAGWDKNLGNLVILNHGNGFQTHYGHNEKLLVEKGQEVLKGDVIALSGNTGHSSAPHLHYEIRKDGVSVDPAAYLD